MIALYVLPYALIEKLAIGKATQSAIIRLLLSEAIRAAPFDEAGYLAEFPDVAGAVERGEWPSGHAHFAAVGYFEGRWAPPFEFSEEWYLAQNPDVAAAIGAGAFQFGEEHYHTAGILEWRSPHESATGDVAAWKQVTQAVAEERQTAFLERNPAVFEAWRKLKTDESETTPAIFPVGALSPRGDLMLGRDGTAFLIGGADTPLPLYGGDVGEAEATAERVVAQFGARQAELAGRHIRYLQLVIPEKMSVFDRAFPVEITTPTPLLAAVEARAAADAALAGVFIPSFKLFRDDADWRRTFRPVDKHLSPYGAYLLAQELLRRLKLPAMPKMEFARTRHAPADMSDRFCGLLESYEETDYRWRVAPEKVAESRQTLGDIGKRQSWRCDTGHLLRVAVFGNSYFDFVERGQYALSWWMARLFSAYEFVWMPQLDLEIVEAVKPDVVICQTAERFLHRLPSG